MSEQTEKIIEITSEAVRALSRIEATLDDDGHQVWSDEDGWMVSVDGDCVDVTINRCNTGFIRRWYVPEVQDANEFRDELVEFVAEIWE